MVQEKVQFIIQLLVWLNQLLEKLLFYGVDVTNIPTHIRCSKFGISWVPQYGGSWSDLTVDDNLMAIAELHIKNKRRKSIKSK